MKTFDLHCDTIGECANNNLALCCNKLDIDLERAKEIGEHTQVFAVWIPDELRGKEAFDYFTRVSDYFYEEIKKNKNVISMYSEKRDTPVKAILAVEGGSGAGGTLKGLEQIYNKGVRIVTLAWNSNNEIAAGAFAEGGITEYGKEFIRFCEKKGIVIDASHLNRQSFYELCEIAEKPFIASHSNANIVNTYNGQHRNLDKEQILLIKEKGGIIGLNFYDAFLEDENARGYDAIKRQIDYFVSLGCEDVLALGSDYDGCTISPEFKGIEKLTEMYGKLFEIGYSKELLDNIFFNNAKKIIDEIT